MGGGSGGDNENEVRAVRGGGDDGWACDLYGGSAMAGQWEFAMRSAGDGDDGWTATTMEVYMVEMRVKMGGDERNGLGFLFRVLNKFSLFSSFFLVFHFQNFVRKRKMKNVKLFS